MEVVFAGSLFYCATIYLALIQTIVSACPNGCTCDWDRRNINCSNQKFSAIPDFGINGSSVETLIFSKNNLTVITNVTFAELISLINLELDHNYIREIDSGAFSSLQKLQQLKLTENVLTSLKSGTFRHMVSLKKLILSENRLESMEAHAIANLPNLTYLDFTTNLFEHLDANSIENLSSLTQLYLKSNQLTEIPTNFLSKIPTLTFLTLNKNNISRIDKYAFSGCPVLKELYLSDNNINYINDLGFMNHNGDRMTNLSLTTLFLFGNRLRGIPSALQSTHTLLHLSLDDNNLERIKPSSLYTLRNLRVLYLSRNKYLEAIDSKAFSGLRELRELFISNNHNLRYIHPDAFIDSKKLEVIFMENNDLRNLSQNIFNWNNIRMINIQSNRFVCSCDLLWIRKSSIIKIRQINTYMTQTNCYNENTTQNILSFSPEELDCPIQDHRKNTESRVITGLIAASVISGLLILCLVVMSCRRRFYHRYIQFKYRRQRDDPLFTVEDTRTKRNDKSRFLSRREETLM